MQRVLNQVDGGFDLLPGLRLSSTEKASVGSILLGTLLYGCGNTDSVVGAPQALKR